VGASHLGGPRHPPAGHDPGSNQRRTIFGAIDLHSGRFLYQVCRKAVSANFTAFGEQLLAAYPTAPVVAAVCDNVIIHHSKIVQAWLASHPRVRVLHGARYSPHDNPVERIWGALKAYLANSPTPTMAGRIRQVHAFFRQHSPTQLLVTAAPTAHPGSPTNTDRTSGRPLSGHQRFRRTAGHRSFSSRSREYASGRFGLWSRRSGVRVPSVTPPLTGQFALHLPSPTSSLTTLARDLQHRRFKLTTARRR
jgi:transposase